MTFSSALAFFDHLMNEGDLDEAALTAFLATKPSDEGLHLDFKSGMLFTPQPVGPKRKSAETEDEKRKRCAFTMRQYVSAFANSEGGVLALGIKDQTREEKQQGKPKTLEPITEMWMGDLREWGSRCVSELIGALGVPPRFKVVDVTGGQVLLITTARAPMLVPVIKGNQQVYFYRVEDEAREVYPHLIADLLLGRRQSAVLTVEAMNARGVLVDVSQTPPQQAWVGNIEAYFLVRNDSLVTSRSVQGRLYAVSWNATAPHPIPALDRAVERRESSATHGFYFQQHATRFDGTGQHGNGEACTFRPFDSATLSIRLGWRIPRRASTTWSAALVLLPDGDAPQWFQVEVDIPERGLDPEYPNALTLRVSRAHGRPWVGEGRRS